MSLENLPKNSAENVFVKACDIKNQYGEYVKRNFSDTPLHYWFSMLDVSEGSNEKMVLLKVPNNFAKEFIQEKYNIELQNTFRDILNSSDVNIDFLIEEDFEHESETSSNLRHFQQNQTITEQKSAFTKKINLINKKYTFENFIKGSNNELAYSIAENISENYDKKIEFNPFVIYSDTGLGKSHLVQAIYHEIKKIDTEKKTKITYVTSEVFLQDFLEFIKKKGSVNYDEKYKNVDILIVDDIQIFENKEKTQEFFHQVYKNLFDRDKKIILTSDRPLSKLQHLTTDLIESIKNGVSVDISYPDYETRLAILNLKAEKMHKLVIPEEILLYIAASYDNVNVRVIEGTLNKVVFAHKNLGVPLVYERIKPLIARETDKYEYLANTNNVSLSKIVQEVSTYFGLSYNELVGRSRKQEIALARHVAIFLSKEITGLSNQMIGDFFNRDFASVSYSIRLVERKLSTSDSDMIECVDHLKDKLL